MEKHGDIADVVIIGAGPAGSNAARVALRAGLRVTQIDKATFQEKSHVLAD